MKTFIIVSTYIVLCFATLTSCKKSDTSPEITSGTVSRPSSSTVAPIRRFLETNDTEDRPKMVRGHVQNVSHSNVPYASVSMYRLPDSTNVGRVNANYLGDFAIDSISGGSYYLKIVASGYFDKYEEVAIPFDEDSLFEVGDITILPL